jgi:hypothetical protein
LCFCSSGPRSTNSRRHHRHGLRLLGRRPSHTTVTIVSDQTKLTRTQVTTDSGSYDFVNLPIGIYTMTFTHDGFTTQKIPWITVEADRTATINTTLRVGQVGTTITVEESPLINAVDTTTGYILEKEQIQSVPLPTGSFTGLAILSPGVIKLLAKDLRIPVKIARELADGLRLREAKQ